MSWLYPWMSDTSSVSQFCLSWVRCFTEQSLNDVDPKHPYLDGSYDDASITRWWPNLDISACQPAKKTIVVKGLTLWSLSACVSSVIERRKPDRRISFLIQTDIISDEPWIEVIRPLTRLFFYSWDRERRIPLPHFNSESVKSMTTKLREPKVSFKLSPRVSTWADFVV